MISYLRVRNLAIVEEFAIEPGPSLNVLTGETGAGKSLLIDSLEFLSGARGSSEAIRTGEEKMAAEAIFHLPKSAAPALEELGIETGDDAVELIVRREIATNGRGRVLLNGAPVTVRDLVAVMEGLLEIHGQNESHRRIAGKSFRELLDEFASTGELVRNCGAAWSSWRSAADELAKLEEAQRELSLRIDLLRYQIDEITQARLQEDEEESLRSEKAILSHAREMIDATAGAYALLEEEEGAALPQIARAEHRLQPLSGSISDIREIFDDLEDIRFRLEEVSRSLARLRDSVRIDPERLDAIEDRLVTIERLRKKYGGSVESVLTHLETSREELNRLTDYEGSLERLRRTEQSRFDEVRALADELSRRRSGEAKRLQKAIQEELDDLAMEGTAVRVVVSSVDRPDSRLQIEGRGIAFGPTGYDQVDILIAPNRGEEPKPMQKIASGGELSRIQLAIAAALFRESEQSAAATLVFDEIDAGIGGRVAEAVGTKLRQLARANQVVCVTHLPQIASLGTTHFRVWKEEAGGRTSARIEKLAARDQRVEELARMVGGRIVTETARNHAEDLLARAAAPQESRKRRPRGAVSRAE